MNYVITVCLRHHFRRRDLQLTLEDIEVGRVIHVGFVEHGFFKFKLNI
jgi:hypothetical protein